MFLNRLRHSLRRSDEGSALAAVIIVAFLLSVMAIAIATVVQSTTRTIGLSEEGLQAQQAADAGMSVAVAQARAGADACAINESTKDTATGNEPRFEVTVVDCSAGEVTFRSEGWGSRSMHSAVEAVYSYGSTISFGSADGAIVTSGIDLNISRVKVVAPGSDANALLLLGDIDCNNVTELQGDLLVLDGSVSLTNGCKVSGSVYADGDVSMSVAGQVGGSVFAGGKLTMSNDTVIGGSAQAGGDVKMTVNAKILGDLRTTGGASIDGTAAVSGNAYVAGKFSMNGSSTSAATASVRGSVYSTAPDQVSIYQGRVGSSTTVGGVENRVGSLYVAGDVRLQGAWVGRDITSTKSGVESTIAPGTSVGGSVKLAGTLNRGWTESSILPRVSERVGGLTPPPSPSMVTPDQLTAGKYAWEDFPYVREHWEAQPAGYDVVELDGSAKSCNVKQTGSTLKALVEARSEPTLIDARKCSPLRLADAVLKIRTDIQFVVADIGADHDLQNVNVTSADAHAHSFSVMMPDPIEGDGPTCAHSNKGINIYGAKLGTSPMISGMVYTPCQVQLGDSGSTWNGQIYAASVSPGGGLMTLNYIPIESPGFGGGAATEPIFGGLLSRRDVAP